MIIKKINTLEYEVSALIAVPHAFTTRLGGVSTGTQESLNLAFGRGDSMENVEENLTRLSRAVPFDLGRLVMTRQTHSDIIRVVTKADHKGLCHRDYPECDALVTADPGTALLVFTADCTPILLWDPETGAVGAAHAGWRGTAADIAGKTLEAMARAYGTRPENVRAAIGPNIGQCHFETDGDVPEALKNTFGRSVADYIRPRGEKYDVDLKAVNALALRRRGVTHVEQSESCTACAPNRFWSHRATHGERGSQGAVIVCGGGL